VASPKGDATFLFFAIVLVGCTNPALQVSEAIERIKRRHGEEVDLFHFFDDRVWQGKGAS
jgi:hypothetical protein